MGQPAAKQGDHIQATDTHIVLVPSPGGPVPTPMPFPFAGVLDGNLSANVNIEGRPAATRDSTSTNVPPHLPQGGPFQKPPSNRATILRGSANVLINGKPAARNSDQAMTCNDPVDSPIGQVVATSTVMIGG